MEQVDVNHMCAQPETPKPMGRLLLIPKQHREWSLPHWPSVLLANRLKGTSTEKMRPENMTWTPIS